MAKGTVADLVLLDADPLNDIHNTTKISGVFLAGKEFDRAALDQMLRNAEAAANSQVADEKKGIEDEIDLNSPAIFSLCCNRVPLVYCRGRESGASLLLF